MTSKVLVCYECYSCGNSKTRIRSNGYPEWIFNHDFHNNVLCRKCFDKLVWSPIKNPISNAKWQANRILYKGRRILLKLPPRKGVCSSCGRTVSSGAINQTQIHHDNYHDNDVLKDTRELCVKCHQKFHFENGNIILK